MSGHRFKVFAGPTKLMEAALNDWAGSLPSGTKIRRTQVSAVTLTDGALVVALVNYELPEAPG
jgi:hypothetical protein